MYKAVLVASYIEAGANLINELEARGVPIQSAFWHYSDEEGLWRLIIVTSHVSSIGPRWLYAALVEILAGFLTRQMPAISADQVMFVPPTNVLYKQVKQGAGLWVKTRPPGDVVFEDTYVYSR